MARGLARQLPAGFEFQALESRAYAGRGADVAFFKKGGTLFALIPGWSGALGFDVACWEPNQDELKSWKRTAEEYEIPETISEYVKSQTLRVRAVELPPFLVEIAAWEPGWKSVDANDAEVRKALRAHQFSGSIEIHQGGSLLRARRKSGGALIAERALPLTYRQAAQGLREFRFPSSDEWEYACGGGRDSLFRWGDHAPYDRYPTDISPAEAEWGRKWVLSGGKLERPPQGFVSDWDFHREPNAFGLRIASDPYKIELTAAAGITRGGDGGCAICGGVGFFAGWLTLATAWYEKECCEHNPDESIMHGYTVCRRVLELR